MPRIALVLACLVGGCFFDADYSGTIHCGSDGKCPSGLACGADRVCRGPGTDAAVADADAPSDAMPDGNQPLLTCVVPGALPSTGGTAMGSTVSRTSMISAQCNGSVMNGADAVYMLDVAAGKQLVVDISTNTGGYQVAAYVIRPCSAVPSCLTNMYAIKGAPISVTTATAGMHYVIVDAVNPATTGDYTLSVTVN